MTARKAFLYWVAVTSVYAVVAFIPFPWRLTSPEPAETVITILHYVCGAWTALFLVYIWERTS
jgi:hypothetical protein